MHEAIPTLPIPLHCVTGTTLPLWAYCRRWYRRMTHRNSNLFCEFWGFHGGDVSSRGLLLTLRGIITQKSSIWKGSCVRPAGPYVASPKLMNGLWLHFVFGGRGLYWDLLGEFNFGSYKSNVIHNLYEARFKRKKQLIAQKQCMTHYKYN